MVMLLFGVLLLGSTTLHLLFSAVRLPLVDRMLIYGLAVSLTVFVAVLAWVVL